MQDRIKLQNGKSSILKCPSDYSPASFAEFLSDLKDGTVYVDVTPNNSTDSDAGVSVIGTALNKSNLLSDETATAMGFEATDDPTINDAFGKFNASQTITEITALANGWAETGGGTGIFVQIISVEGMTDKVNPNYEANIPSSATSGDALNIIAGFSMIGRLVTGDGTVTLYCYGQTPSVNIPIALKGI